jgi:glycosyltransferase involved in cell wall biosynthesis
MAHKKIILTVIIATYNSEKTLPLVMESLVTQTFNENVELLIIDGGSKDSTISIAKKYKCRVIHNPRIEPIYGKFLAYTKAKGRYIMYLDHDEVLVNKDSIRNKLAIFKEIPDVKMVIGSGYRNPPNYAFINEYINEFGDPFSFFIYRLSKKYGLFINQMKKRYTYIKETNRYIIFSFERYKSLPIIELVAAGSMFDAGYIKKDYPETLKNMQLVPHFFYLLLKKKPYLAMIKNDPILHYSSDTLSKYYKKIQWRVKNNIYHISTIGESGFTGRDKYQSRYNRIKKYFFIPYVISLIFPLYDSISLSITRKNIKYFLHFPLTLYTGWLILYNSVLKMMGYRPLLKNYDESKVVYTS